jgi:hypothetical protein
VGWVVQPVFAMELNIRDSELIKRIQSYFGVGILVINKAKINLTVEGVEKIKVIKSGMN